MVHGLFFKWEDSAALKHHCGFCERPLNHPGARVSCYGKHSEPCIRYHQAMFMRLRGHTCAYCLSIDEAHHKRHIDIAERIRCLYESCGEVDWTIIPSDAHERGRMREPGDHRAVNKHSNSSPTLDDTLASRREKKDAKCLARAASRSKVITQDEILYVDGVLHPADGICDSGSPRNSEEVDEIERHLRYHAQVYNSQADRRGLRKLAHFPDADVDFEIAMERILETFRITDLIRRNTRNRGLHGKEMKKFETFVEDFKLAVVEDIVLVKKDELEIRMRRAGYMRYTNKTAVTRVEDRYIDKDWRTGGRLASSSSDSSGASTSLAYVSVTCTREGIPAVSSQLPSAHSPDRRHLENIHTRVSGEDGLDEATIEPYHAPLLPLLPDPTPSRKAISLRVVAGDSTKEALDPSGANPDEDLDAEYSFECRSNPWQIATNSNKISSIGKPFKATSNHAAGIFHQESVNLEVSRLLSPKHIACTKPTLDAPSVQAASYEAVSASRSPEQFLNANVKSKTERTNSQPIISQKKKAKKEREYKRKAKKLARPEGELIVHTTDLVTHGAACDKGDKAGQEDLVTSTQSAVEDGKATAHPSILTAQCLAEAKKNLDVQSVPDPNLKAVKEAEVVSPAAPFVTSHRKHLHWHRFTRNLLVDQLTLPFMTMWHTPPNGIPENDATPCAFERSGEPDCPFHGFSSDREPACACCSYRKEMCHITYPGVGECSFGPLNRLHCDKLLSMYEKHSRTRGRLMLLDDVIYNYVHDTIGTPYGHCITETMPKALASEYAEFFGYSKPAGPLMEQEHKFHCLAAKNKVNKHILSRDLLHKMQLNFEPLKCTYTCYCHAKVRPGVVPQGTMICSHRGCKDVYFHKACIPKGQVGNVSRWYCTQCSLEMKALAIDTLRGAAGQDHSCEFQSQIITDMMKMPDDVFEKVKMRMATMVTKV